MEDEIFLDNECFHCEIRPSMVGYIADGLACEICMQNPKLAAKKIGLHMPKIKIVTVSKHDILRASTVKNFNFSNCNPIPRKVDEETERSMKRKIGELKNSQLVKRNVWYDRINFLINGIKIKLTNINPRNIELVEFEDVDKPVVYNEQVYQVCVSDWDGDCVLKDDINGVVILKNAFSGDELYDTALLSYLTEHPVNNIRQIKHNDQILNGSTPELQLLVDLYYSNFSYI